MKKADHKLRWAFYKLNRIMGSWEYYHKRTRLHSIPFISNIEPTNCCNFQCVFCWVNRSGRPKGYMTKELFHKILEENNHNLTNVSLFFHGESLLHPDFHYMVHRLAEIGCGVGFTTNGSLLTPTTTRDLIMEGLGAVDVSFQGVSKEIYEGEQRGGKYEITEYNIQELIRLRNLLKPSMKVYTSIIRTENAIPHVPSHVQKWENRGAKVIVVSLGDGFGMLHGKPHRRTDNLICSVPWENLAIMWNGDVFPCCCYEGNPLGNVNDNTVDEIWNNKAYRQLRFQMLYDPENLPFPCSCCYYPVDRYEIYGALPSAEKEILSAMNKIIILIVGRYHPP